MYLNLLVVSCDENFYAVNVVNIVRVIRALEITPIPESKHTICGIFDLQGKIIPLISIRNLFSLSEKKMDLEDSIIIFQASDHQLGLLFDHIEGVFELEEENISNIEDFFHGRLMSHTVKWSDKLIPVLDIDYLLNQMNPNIETYIEKVDTDHVSA